MGSTRPDRTEYGAFYHGYIELVTHDDLVEALGTSGERMDELLSRHPDSGTQAYAPGKWTVAQVVQHLIDSERIFNARALRIARADTTPLPGFDQDAYAVHTPPGGDLQALAAEFTIVRCSTQMLYQGFSDPVMLRRGTASGHPLSVRAMGFITAGHTIHHLRHFGERYGLK